MKTLMSLGLAVLVGAVVTCAYAASACCNTSPCCKEQAACCK